MPQTFKKSVAPGTGAPSSDVLLDPTTGVPVFSLPSVALGFLQAGCLRVVLNAISKIIILNNCFVLPGHWVEIALSFLFWFLPHSPVVAS